MKINKVRIRNFKVFKDFLVDFSSSDTIVFDGPNGFGKTTIYDAIELALTGNIRRYDAMKRDLLDGRQTYTENPFFYENAAKEESISIQIQFTSNEKIFILERIAQSDLIGGLIDFKIYKLYSKTKFDDAERTLIEDEHSFLTEIFGKNYSSNFQFLNYVEQEECLFLLKNSDKGRKQHIAHLFDLKEFEEKIRRIEELKKSVDTLCSSGKKNEITALDAEIKQIREHLSTEVSESEYLKLFSDLSIDWDRDNIDFKTINYNNIAGPGGVLERIKLLASRKEIFKQHRRNQGVNYLIDNRQNLISFLKYSNFFLRKDEYRVLRNEVKSIMALSNQLTNITDANLVSTFEISPFKFISDELKEQFNREKEELTTSLRELSGLDRIYAEISTSRSLLEEKLIVLKDSGNANGECLLCGYDWGSVEELLKNIELRANQIREINSDKSSRFETGFQAFKAGVVQELLGLLDQRVIELNLDDDFVGELLNIEDGRFTELVASLNFLKFDYTRFVNLIPSDKAVILIEELNAELSALKVAIEEQLIEADFQQIFKEYFSGKLENIDKLVLFNIDQKQNYLKYLWSLSQNELLNSKSVVYAIENQRYSDADKISKALNTLKVKYRASLSAFQKKIIGDIEIIFHVYSGRIMQCFQGGLGLFIFSEKDGIRFQSNPRKTYDAVFSMSSGQLSALIIAFTLALHKKYSQNKLILIDDPVQTMDELNLYGFIDLLRNEFHTDQIILSTHEDMMSSFMRYKFKNYNLSEKRINLKEMLQISM